MTLDEAIKHAEEVAEEQDMKAGFDTDYSCYQMSDAERNQCKECAEEHRQLAEWLKDYKRLLEQQNALFKSELLKDCESCKAHEVYIFNNIKDEIGKQERWLAQAGYNAYNVDIAFDAIKRVIAESEVQE